MQKPEELVEKITKEEQELDIKLSDLECFMMSADFIKVSPEQKTLLEQQHKVMTEYKLILIKRAHRINWEAGRDKAAAEIKEALESEEPDISDLLECPYNNTGNHRFCIARQKNRCTSSGSYCFKQGMELKEKAETEEPSKDFCSDCPYYNKAKNECTNRNRKDGKCWIVSDPAAEKYPQCPYSDPNVYIRCLYITGTHCCRSQHSECFKLGSEIRNNGIRKSEGEKDGTQSDK